MRQYWTAGEDKVIVKFIEKNPGNLQMAFEMASKQLSGRSPQAISRRYYHEIKEKSRALVVLSKRGILHPNTKIVRRNNTQKVSALELAEMALKRLDKSQKLELIEKILSE